MPGARRPGLEADVTRVVRGSAHMLALSLATNIISIVVFMFMTRKLAVAEMGVWTAMWMVLSVASLFITLISAPVKFISQAIGAGEDYGSIAASILLGRGAIAGAIALTCFTSSGWLSEWLLRTPDYALIFQLVGADIFLYNLYMSLNICLLGLNKTRDVFFSGTLACLYRQIYILVFMLLGQGLYGLALAWLIGDALACFYPAVILLTEGHLRLPSISEALRILSGVVKFSIPIFLTNLSTFILSWFDRAVILGQGNLEGLGIYQVASTAYGVLLAIPTAIGTAISPYYGEKFGGKKHEDVRLTTKAISKYLGLLFIPAALGLAALSHIVLFVFAGEAYARGYLILMMISVFGVTTMLTPSLLNYLITYERTIAYLAIKLSSAALGVILALFLLPVYGALGVALARSLASAVLAALCVLITREALEIEWSSILKCLLAGSVMASVVYIFQELTYNVYLLPAYVLLGAGVYGLMIRLLGVLNRDDIRAITSVFPGPLREISLKMLGFLASRAYEPGSIASESS